MYYYSYNVAIAKVYEIWYNRRIEQRQYTSAKKEVCMDFITLLFVALGAGASFVDLVETTVAFRAEQLNIVDELE